MSRLLVCHIGEELQPSDVSRKCGDLGGGGGTLIAAILGDAGYFLTDKTERPGRLSLSTLRKSNNQKVDNFTSLRLFVGASDQPNLYKVREAVVTRQPAGAITLPETQHETIDQTSFAGGSSRLPVRVSLEELRS